MSTKKMVIMVICSMSIPNCPPGDDSLPYDYLRLVTLHRLVKHVTDPEAKKYLEWVIEIDTQMACVHKARHEKIESGNPYKEFSKKFRKWLKGHVKNYPYQKF